MDSSFFQGGEGEFNIKEEIQAMEARSPPQPIEGLQSTRPPPFLTKTYDMVEDPQTNAVVSWSSANNSFVVWNSHQFSMDLLPKYFKHNNFSSFVRQLNTYGFRKVDPDRWEFANEGFLRGQKHLLKHIQRRRPPSQGQQQQQQGLGACVEVGQFGMEGEIERLRRDKSVLMMEVVRLRHQQQATRNQMQVMGQRIQATEHRQQQMMTFLARAMRNPTFLSQLAQKNQVTKQLDGAKKRRRLPQGEEDGGEAEECQSPSQSSSSQVQIVKYQSNYSTSAPSDPSTTSPMEAFFSNLAQPEDPPNPANDLLHQNGSTQEGLLSPTKFDALQGFEPEAVFDASGALGMGTGDACTSAGNANEDPSATADLDFKTVDVFWEELLGEEFDSQEDSEIEVEPNFPPS
ncbi:heat stress transcription factor A-2 [Cryptomeria japonica]|uniref:heat stress transcription factor A-2 n=1 Tax=Cryptomeria japonica TaxID=3369 RepID=UPI0027DA41C6|nr:heat stress transcription factor A-2 [Cryptomeria japonica]XP_057844673.2 heat stress transcription factor A-2 [Cryptomeria japonica]